MAAAAAVDPMMVDLNLGFAHALGTAVSLLLRVAGCVIMHGTHDQVSQLI